ncbi:hypothetical protein CEUSTIGMA_g816.t1 [Chlamydomonas eustigma]|uniref:PAS domain-containing protein n=1 Tax=Chlamydomonas eustigma TaxID=1157962 RepID=A0A250WRC1_9CHLO|nr:hypothetical protein CEUSTIGMA_g816.t1 [Chlamydomonas eustigma]|eukprot:GAX73363.1 hypothetical protein CEUSTIGMA_g816.t1 [Chlamydomonas eustigma]
MSVFGSETGSAWSGNEETNFANQKNDFMSKLGIPVDDEDQDFEKEDTTFLKGFFGERVVTWKFVAFKIILDVWQLLTLTINPQYGWTFDGNEMWWQNQSFDYVWPITFLRWFGVVFFQMLDIVSMTFFLMTLDCQYFGVDPVVIGYNQEFPASYCWSFPYVINAIVAAISLAIFVLLSAAFQMGEMELNMLTKNMLGMAHSKAEVMTFLIKFLMTSASVFLNSLEWLSSFYLCGSCLLLYITLMWEPFYHDWVNHTRAAVNGSLFYSSLVLVFLVYKPMLKENEYGDANAAAWKYEFNCTIALIVGLIPAATLAYYASVLRLRHISRIVQKFRDAPSGMNTLLIHKFTDAREVEMCARCGRRWIDDLTVDKESVDMAYTILKAGMEQLPGDVFMIILYSSFLIDVKDSFQSGLTELAAARKADKGILEKFALYSREQLHTQKTSGARGSQGADLVSYVEQQRSYRLAMKVNRETFDATSEFWGSLLKPHVHLSTLTKRVAVLDERVEEATKMYRNLLQRSPDNWMLIRMYGLFLELVRNDPWGASKNYAEADRLMQMEEELKNSAFMIESAIAASEIKGEKVTDGVNKGVIIMNAKCLVQNVNKAACDMTGYSQKELQGKNINILIPRPFSDQHDQYVRKYITTGISTMLNQDRELVILHKNRHVLGVSIHTTKVAGFGMDSVFMGVFDVLPPPPNTARAWVLGNGVVLSVDSTFSDWFGYRPEDLPGAYFSNFVSDSSKLDEVFKSVGNSQQGLPKPIPTRKAPDTERKLADYQMSAATLFGEFVEDCDALVKDEDGQTHISGIDIKHKYAGAMRCNVSIRYGGGAQAQGFFVLTISCEDNKASMVTDTKGKLLHVSKAIAADLGFSVVDLLGELADNVWDVILPEPFNALHHIHAVRELSPAPPPSYSCRTGLSVCLMATTDNGPKPLPYKLQVKQRKQEKMGDTVNLVSLEKCTMEQATNERLLSVLTDQKGVITHVRGNTPPSLFGFNPKIMVGKPISTFVNIFQSEDAHNEREALRHFQDVFTELAIRSLDAPGESFRVGITPPLKSAAVRLDGLSSVLALHKHSKATVAAVMQMTVHFKENESDEEGTYGSSEDVLSLLPTSAVQVTAQVTAVDGVVKKVQDDSELEEEEISMPSLTGSRCDRAQPHGVMLKVLSRRNGQLCSPDKMTPDKKDCNTALNGSDEFLNALNEGEEGLMIEINLWKADLLTGLLLMERTGRVVHPAEQFPFSDPGLVLGVKQEDLYGASVCDIFPNLVGKSASKLFLPAFGDLPQETATKKGGLKMSTKDIERQSALPGAVNKITLNHLADGQPLTLTFQAVNVNRNGKKRICLILRPSEPLPGLSFFRDILKANPPTSIERRASLSTAHVKNLSLSLSLGRKKPTGGVERHGSSVFYQTGSVPLPHDTSQDGGESMTKAKCAADKGDGSLTRLSRQPSRVMLSRSAKPPAASTQLQQKASNVVLGAVPTLEELVEELQDPDVSVAGSARLPVENRVDDSSDGEEAEQKKAAAKGIQLASSWVLSGGLVSAPKTQVGSRDLFQSTEMVRVSPRDSDDKALPPDHTSPAQLLNDDDDEPTPNLGTALMRGKLKSSVPDLHAIVNAGKVQGSLNAGRGKQDFETASNGASDNLGPVPGGSDMQDTDFRRGQRYKRMVRILSSEQALRCIKSYKYKSLGVIFFVLMASVASFVTMLTLLTTQENQTNRLNTLGSVGTGMGEIFVRALSLGVLFDGYGYADLPALTGESDIVVQLSKLDIACNVLEKTLLKAYQQVLSIQDPILEEIWNTPSLMIYTYVDLAAGGTAMGTTNYSFWDAANQYLSDAQYIYQNAYAHNETRGTSSWRDWSFVNYLSSNSNTLFLAIFNSLDSIVQDLNTSALQLNTVQLVLLGVIGCMCCLSTSFFVFFMNTQVNNVRFTIYSTFMVIPTAIVKTMVKLEPDAINADSGKKDGEDEGPTKYNLLKNLNAQLETQVTAWERVKGLFVFLKKRVHPVSLYAPRRTLVVSSRKAIFQSLPFLIWGVMMIIIYLVGYFQLSQITNPIALFNLVNVVTVRYYRTFSLALNMSVTRNVEDKETQRQYLERNFRFPLDYNVMLYGNSAEPSLREAYILLASRGAVSSAEGYYILYQDHDCLRLPDTSPCLSSNSSLYEYTVHGLDRAVQAFIANINVTFEDTGLAPHLSDPTFNVIWNLRNDILGGLSLMNSAYLSRVSSVYSYVLTVHIVGLALSCVLLLLYYIFMLRPSLTELTKSRRRIAYLLSTLPNDIDVVGLIKKAVTKTIMGLEPDSTSATTAGSFAIGGSMGGSMTASLSPYLDQIKD